jgi:lysophospholipase L1-like esterase
MASDDDVLATVSNGPSTTQQLIDLTSTSPSDGTFVPTSAAGTIGDNPLVLFNWDPATQLTSLLAAEAAGKGSVIVAIGDSTTLGFGSATSGFRELSYPVEMAQALAADGVAAQSDNSLGQGNENGASTDNRIALFGGAAYDGVYDAGGQVIETMAAGAGYSFTTNTPGNYDRVTLSYVDTGSGSVTVSVDGTAAGTLQFGNTGNTLSQTIDVPAGMHSQITVTAKSANPVYIQGTAFSSSTANAIQVYNAGIGGWGSGNANTSVYDGSVLTGSSEGFGQIAGSVALKPNLALIDLGINDMSGFANIVNGQLVSVPAATIVANITQIIATLRAAGSDVIIIIPQPFSDPSYATQLPALRTALEALSIAENVPLIDLSATYDNNFSALAASGLMSDNLHPDATLYADIGSQIAALLANTIKGTDNATAVTVDGTAGNNTLAGTASINTLEGDGGNDIYHVNATDQTDTVINNLPTSTAPAGDLDIGAFSHDQLWFQQSGENLVISILGTGQQVVVQDWFAGTGGEALEKILAGDGALSHASLAPLLAAMAAYALANPGFDPSTTPDTRLADSDFQGSLATAVARAWQLGAEAPPCFCAGTRLRTPGGEAAVEDLRIGDAVMTRHAGPQRIKWIGRRSYAAPFAAKNPALQPVCIRRSALAPGVPARDLWVSPGHGIQLGGVLVHALRLVNGVNVVQPGDVARITYLHIELDNHEIMFAEGCAAESFLALDFRARFHNAAEFHRLYPAGAVAGGMCLAQLDDGFLLEALLARVAARAGIAQKPAQGPLRGYVEALGTACVGWAQAVLRPEAPICVDILAGRRRAARVLANRPRADLRQAGLGTGNNGFDTRLPPRVTGAMAVREAAAGHALATTPELARQCT